MKYLKDRNGETAHSKVAETDVASNSLLNNNRRMHFRPNRRTIAVRNHG